MLFGLFPCYALLGVISAKLVTCSVWGPQKIYFLVYSPILDMKRLYEISSRFKNPNYVAPAKFKEEKAITHPWPKNYISSRPTKTVKQNYIYIYTLLLGVKYKFVDTSDGAGG